MEGAHVGRPSRPIVAFACLILLAPGALAQPHLVAVVPDLPGPGPGDEAVAIVSAAGWDLSGHRLSDGEGTWVFPDGTWIGPGQEVWVAGDADRFATFHGAPADLSWTGTPGFILANDGDDVCLQDPGGVALDCFSWGPGAEITYRSPGAVYRNEDNGWVTPRIHRIGESQIAPQTFDVAALRPFLLPDHGLATLLPLITGATERLHVHVYDLRHVALVDALENTLRERPGLDVQVLIDGRVVGHDAGQREEVAWGLARLQDAGATVVRADGGRFTHHHLKVLVADDAVVVQSENWVPTGVALDATWGNRGWGVVVHDTRLADWFVGWMAEDRTAWDMAAPRAGQGPEPLRMAAREGENEPRPTVPVLQGLFLVRPLVAPDHTARPENDPLLALLRSATTRIWTQQLRLDLQESNRLGWDAPDRYVDALAEAAGRGVDVRVQLQGPFGQSDDNEPAAAWLAQHGVVVQRPELPGIVTLHNKGWIVDGAVVVGSMNGHHASRSGNREVSLILEGPGVAEPYATWFLADWQEAPSLWIDAPAPVPILLVLTALALLLRRP